LEFKKQLGVAENINLVTEKTIKDKWGEKHLKKRRKS
jgi:hypothetical protein